MLVSEHHLDVYPQGEKSPFYKLINLNAKIIGLGEKVVSLSFVHCVEDKMKEQFPHKTLMDKEFVCKAINYEGEQITVKTKVAHSQIKNRNIKRYFKSNISSDICKQFKFNGVNFFSCSAPNLIYRMEDLAKQSITIYEGVLEKN
jgi:aminoglycoside N3'-acetyltransferase